METGNYRGIHLKIVSQFQGQLELGISDVVKDKIFKDKHALYYSFTLNKIESKFHSTWHTKQYVARIYIIRNYTNQENVSYQEYEFEIPHKQVKFHITQLIHY